MKNLKKILSVIIVIVICLSLCSCKELDMLRDQQAFFNENGIVYKEMLYKPVTNAQNLNYDYIHEIDLNVTDPGVPVLASLLISFEYSINKEKTVISSGYDGEWYVREDKYAIYEQAMKDGIKYTKMGFEYFDFDLGENVDYIMTESEKQAVMSLLFTEPITDAGENYYEELFLFEQSDDALFRRSDIYSICQQNDSYYLVVYDNDADNTWEVSGVYASTPLTDTLFESFFNKGYDKPEYDF